MNSLVDALHLRPHPEGGFYREMHRSETIIRELDQVDKSALTSIYYLLSGKDFSSWHRIKSDEAWYFHIGCDVIIYFFDESKLLQTVQLGLKSNHFQVTIPANTWFAAKPVDENSFCLVSCAVAPGFEFNDFEIGERESLLQEFGRSSDQIEAIKALTRI
ncbi:cupin domain-containing protein [Polynucleobacter sp. CS-Odin-A6]|uniref:cupin domain-containing protein n=1 Tax=Polynucleobacter sp. CS-Odin-A6 TaxID=2689106 RepID=UPI001C0B893B|nr:cupin domain-containing protein [Polynucleobacter sp. CS-Odin-A6]